MINFCFNSFFPLFHNFSYHRCEKFFYPLPNHNTEF
nr:MAG TPA: hypothetical protein [Caudoviricetes sp.]